MTTKEGVKEGKKYPPQMFLEKKTRTKTMTTNKHEGEGADPPPFFVSCNPPDNSESRLSKILYNVYNKPQT